MLIEILAFLGVAGLGVALRAADSFETDVLPSTAGDLKVTFIGHGTLMFECGDRVVHVDPWSNLADYSKLPKADLMLITHEHGDHLDPAAIKALRTDNTKIVVSESCSKRIPDGIVMKNGDVQTLMGVKIEAVPAYNVLHKRENGQPFHPKGVGNGYVLTFGNRRVYVAGDTEDIPEMQALSGIDVAFLPMNLPYTMTPEMVANAARMFRPKILYPYHYGDTDPMKLIELLRAEKNIEVRIRKMR